MGFVRSNYDAFWSLFPGAYIRKYVGAVRVPVVKAGLVTESSQSSLVMRENR